MMLRRPGSIFSKLSSDTKYYVLPTKYSTEDLMAGTIPCVLGKPLHSDTPDWSGGHNYNVTDRDLFHIVNDIHQEILWTGYRNETNEDGTQGVLYVDNKHPVIVFLPPAALVNQSFPALCEREKASTVIDDSTITPNEEETLREGTTCDSKSGFVEGMIVGVAIGAFSVGAAGITAMLARRLYKYRKDPEQQRTIHTELKTSSGQSTAFTGIHNYVDINDEGNEQLYQYVDGNHQYAYQASGNEADYTGLDARKHENSASKASDESTESSEQSTAFTGIHNYVDINNEGNEQLYQYVDGNHQYANQASSFEAGYSKLYVNRA
ncbi:uncharacterized protein LOC128244981 isoform X2 [Mya arenaria]|uniref:uncharacterized protein LOC128244981 isoform X2 n=1 Tax=Mya arenaria TaxID=6604 RepID=UPI0022DF433C|nr:uncharacterized protein LOC128244981 isoform X2 [Mya arenaria]